MKSLPKIIVVIGPTASGKSDLAVEIAKKRNGEIISADSRQIYKYLNIGSGKISEKEMKNIPHYCLNIVNPIKYSKKYKKDYQNFSVNEYLKFANKSIKDILNKNKTPIICGGTGLYIDGIIYGLPKNAKLNKKLREDLENKNLDEILNIIKKLNKEKYLDLVNNENGSERNNKRRLIRIIEILEEKKENNQEIQIEKLNKNPKYDVEFVFIEKDKEELRERINKRLENRLAKKQKYVFEDKIYKFNLIDEIKFLINNLKMDKDWLISLGLEYKYVTLYLENKISLEKMKEEIQNKSWQYAKRQMVWNKRYKK